MCLLKHLMVRRFLREGEREFQIDDPENARLILYRSMCGLGGINLFEAYLLVDLVKSERMYSGVSSLHYYSCFGNGRSVRVFSSSSVHIERKERESVGFFFLRWTSLQLS